MGAGLDRVAVFFREDAAVLGQPEGTERPEGEVHDRIREALAKSAEFWFDLLDSTGLEAEAALPALWELVWAGEVTNDAWTPLRAGRRYGVPKPERRPRRFSRRRATAITATQGTVVAHRPPLRRRAGPAGAGRAPAGASGDRHARRRSRGGNPGRLLAPSTASSRRSRRSASAAAATSSRASAARSSRSAERSSGSGSCGLARTSRRIDVSVLAAADPAQPYGAALAWPKRAGARAARVAGAYVVLIGGEAVLFVERGGKTLVPLRDPDPEWLRPALAALVEHVKSRRGTKRLAVERFDGEPVGETDAMPLLVEAGFIAGPRRAVLRP